jgi:predicted ATPase
MAMYSEAIAQLKQEFAFHLSKLYRQTVLNLMTSSKDSISSPPYRLIGKVHNKDTLLSSQPQENDRSSIFHLYFNQLNLCYLFQEYSQAVELCTPLTLQTIPRWIRPKQ